MKPLFFKEIEPEFRAKIPVSSKAAAYKLKEFLEKEFKRRFLEGQEREVVSKKEFGLVFKLVGTADAPALFFKTNQKMGPEEFKKLIAENKELKDIVFAEKIEFGEISRF